MQNYYINRDCINQECMARARHRTPRDLPVDLEREPVPRKSFTKRNQGPDKNFFYGAGIVLLAAMIFPPVKRSLQAVAARTMEEGVDLVNRARGIGVRAKEEIEDIVAEANFNKLRSVIDNEIDRKIKGKHKV